MKNNTQVIFPHITFKSLEKCEYDVTNIAGRQCCSIYGKRKCENCEQRPFFTTGLYLIRTKEGTEILSRPPVKSSLGWLYGYPTKITQEEPKQVHIRRQGTTTTAVPPKYRVRR